MKHKNSRKSSQRNSRSKNSRNRTLKTLKTFRKGAGIITTKRLTCDPQTLKSEKLLSMMPDRELHSEYQRCCSKKSWIGRKNKNKYCKSIVEQNKINKNLFKYEKYNDEAFRTELVK